MYCRNCGKEIDDKAVICIHCGCAVMENQTPQMNPEYAQPKTGMGILLGLIGLIIGIAIYPEGTIARKTFMKSCLITIGISLAVEIVVGVVYSTILMSMFMAY